MNTQPRMYTISLLNDLHYHFPELLYRPERFQSVQDVLRYIGEVASQNPYERNREAYLRSNSTSSSSSSSSSSSTSSNSTSAPPRGRRISQPVYQRSSTGFSSLFGGSPLTSNVRINIPLSTSGAASASSSSMDPLISSLLTGLLSGDSQIGSVSDLYFQILQRGGTESEQPVPTQDDVYRATSIPTIHEVVDGTCSICQEPCQSDGPTCRRINHCGHLFHLACIDTWFQTHSTCPMCRYDIRQG